MEDYCDCPIPFGSKTCQHCGKLVDPELPTEPPSEKDSDGAPLGTQTLWYASLNGMPQSVESMIPEGQPQAPKGYHWTLVSIDQLDNVFTTEKEAIQAAIKLRIVEIERLYAEKNVLDNRYEVLEQAEIDSESFNRR